MTPAKKVSATSVSKQDTIAATIAPDIYIMNDFLKKSSVKINLFMTRIQRYQ